MKLTAKLFTTSNEDLEKKEHPFGEKEFPFAKVESKKKNPFNNQQHESIKMYNLLFFL